MTIICDDIGIKKLNLHIVKSKLWKIISKSLLLAVVISFFSTYFYTIWNYYDPVQHKFVEPIAKASNSYISGVEFYTDSDGYLRQHFHVDQTFDQGYQNGYGGC